MALHGVVYGDRMYAGQIPISTIMDCNIVYRICCPPGRPMHIYFCEERSRLLYCTFCGGNALQLRDFRVENL